MSLFDPNSGAARAIGIALRTAHLGAMAVLVGGIELGAPGPSLRSWQVATFATGAALLASEASHSRHWVYQGRGLATLAHVGAPPARIRRSQSHGRCGGLGRGRPRESPAQDRAQVVAQAREGDGLIVTIIPWCGVG